MRDPDTGISKGFGFIAFDSFEASGGSCWPRLGLPATAACQGIVQIVTTSCASGDSAAAAGLPLPCCACSASFGTPPRICLADAVLQAIDGRFSPAMLGLLR